MTFQDLQMDDNAGKFNVSVGGRVGIFHSATPTSILIYGYGVYAGDEVPPDDILVPIIGPVHQLGIKLPKLVLDDGTIIWGSEAWWSDENHLVEMCKNRDIVKVKIESVRRRARASWERANQDLDEVEKSLPNDPYCG
jgi:hypothetical protein